MKLLYCLVCLSISANAKIYKRCELAVELKYKYEIDAKEIRVWVCIAKHESNFNTSAVNLASGDHGLFQISDLYWCGVNNKNGACYSNCRSFEDEDIGDDLRCIRRIFNEHKRLSGNGFNAWVVYTQYCKENTENYIQGCFDYQDTSTTTEVPSSTDDSDEYEFPPLPVFPRRKNIILTPPWLFDENDIFYYDIPF